MPTQYIWTGATSSDSSVSTNFTPNGNPITGDSLLVDGRATNAIAASSAMAGITLAKLVITSACKQSIGTAAAPLVVGATIALINSPQDDGRTGTGPALVSIDFGSIQTAATVYASPDSGAAGLQPVLLKGTHVSNTLTVAGGNVGWDTVTPGTASNVATLTVSGKKSRAVIGSGCTLTTVNQSDGAIVLGCAVTTVSQSGGTLTTTGSGAVATATIGGAASFNSTGTITTLGVTGSGRADFSGSAAARTVTNATCYGPSSTVNADNGLPLSVTFTNGVILSQGAKSNQVNFGGPLKVTPS